MADVTDCDYCGNISICTDDGAGGKGCKACLDKQDRKTPDVATIKVGDKVRSFDFPGRPDGRALTGPRACYVEGTVEAIGAFDEFPDCDRYKIKVRETVFRGVSRPPHVEYIFPPVNGTPNAFFDETFNGVEIVESA